MSLDRDAEQKHRLMNLAAYNRAELAYHREDKEEDEELKTRIQKLEAALNNRFCLKHQERFLGPGKHSSYEGDPLTPSGAGCIYCNMIRLEAKNEKLREIGKKLDPQWIIRVLLGDLLPLEGNRIKVLGALADLKDFLGDS